MIYYFDPIKIDGLDYDNFFALFGHCDQLLCQYDEQYNRWALAGYAGDNRDEFVAILRTNPLYSDLSKYSFMHGPKIMKLVLDRLSEHESDHSS